MTSAFGDRGWRRRKVLVPFALRKRNRAWNICRRRRMRWRAKALRASATSIRDSDSQGDGRRGVSGRYATTRNWKHSLTALWMSLPRPRPNGYLYPRTPPAWAQRKT